MDYTPDFALGRARLATREAGRWMDLLQFRKIPNGASFSPTVSTYHDMMDPKSTDAKRLSACQSMLYDVCLSAQIERRNWKAKFHPVNRAVIDPYGFALRTTLEGAALELVDRKLLEAISYFNFAMK